jgi:uncharacterized protein
MRPHDGEGDMTATIREQTRTLSRLQKLELEARRLAGLLSRVQERTDALHTRLKESEAPIGSAHRLQEELQKKYRSQEAEFKVNQERIARSHEKLRAVKNNKEYQSGLKEIDDLALAGSKLEDEMIACLDEIEAARSYLKEHQAAAERLAAEIRLEMDQVEEEAQAATVRLASLRVRSEELARHVAPEILALYRRIRDRKSDGVALAEVRAEVCGGCYVNIPPQMYNELQRRDRLKHCPNCDRIIYWDDDDERSEEPG